MAFTQDFRTQRRNFNDGETRIGETDRLWYDSITNTIRISDGVTPGGTIVGGGSGGSDYTLPTASTTVKGGVKVDGTTIRITDQVISGFSGSYTDLTSKPALFDGAYASLTGKPTLFSGSYTDLTDKPTIPSLTGYATETFVTTRGYLTSVGTISYNDLSNKPTLFSGSYTDLTNKPTLFSGSYTDLTNKPTIPTTVTVNGTSITLGSSGTVTSAAGTLTGSTLASGVTASSLTSVGTLTGLTVNSTSSTPVSITADGRPGTDTNSWSFVSNQSIGGPRAWIQFPDSTLQTTAWTGSIAYASVTGTPTLATVATSGSYTDLTNKPTIPTTVTVNGTSITLGSSGTVTAAAGTLTGTTLNSTVVSSSLTSVGTLTSLTSTGSVTANHTTAFIAGDNAISNIALQIPREGAIRNLYNGAANNMYFDVSIGGTSQGQFQFRSSSAYTNILTMSPTAFTVNTDAVVTARTPSFGRLPWNSAIDTELTIDDYRWRITNSGGIYAQVISNTGGTKNSAWTAVAAISGQAVAQGGSTGILLPNNSWTTLYTFGSMASAGDTVTVTFQDKNQGRIYRVTFMRSDNGSTTGYNIIAERLL